MFKGYKNMKNNIIGSFICLGWTKCCMSASQEVLARNTEVPPFIFQSYTWIFHLYSLPSSPLFPLCLSSLTFFLSSFLTDSFLLFPSLNSYHLRNPTLWIFSCSSLWNVRHMTWTVPPFELFVRILIQTYGFRYRSIRDGRLWVLVLFLADLLIWKAKIFSFYASYLKVSYITWPNLP